MGRTVLTVLGLGVGVAMVVAITAVSNGLDDAQQQVLNPLASVGTDLLVTRPVQDSGTTANQQQQQASPPSSDPAQSDPAQGAQTGAAPTRRFGLGGGGGPGGGQNGGLSPEDEQALVQENSSVLTDLSKLGNPGDHFVHDFFLPATQLTFPDTEAQTIADLPGVDTVSQGLTLVAQHQEGTVPQIVAQVQTGGDQVQVDQQIDPPTPEEQAQIQACIQANGGFTGGAAEAEAPHPRRRTAAGGGGGGGGRFGGALAQCLPERLQRFRGTVQTPQRTITQALNPPQTDIQTESYSIAGVDLSQPDVGLITPAQVTGGTFFTGTPDAHEAVLAQAYAQRKNLNVGDTIDLNGTTFTVVGLAEPPLGGSAADVYLSLTDLQTLSNRAGRTNVLLVRATKATDVEHAHHGYPGCVPGRDRHECRTALRPDIGILGRRIESGEPPRQCRRRRGADRGVLHRGAAHPVVRVQARPRTRDAESDRVATEPGGPPDRRRVGGDRHTRRPARGRDRHRRRLLGDEDRSHTPSHRATVIGRWRVRARTSEHERRRSDHRPPRTHPHLGPRPRPGVGDPRRSHRRSGGACAPHASAPPTHS